MARARVVIGWALLGLAGVALAVGITMTATSVTSQRVGLESEPLSAGRDLVPPSARTATTRTTAPARTSTMPPARTATSTPTAAAPAPVASPPPAAGPSAPPVSADDDGADDDGRGRGRGRGGDDEGDDD